MQWPRRCALVAAGLALIALPHPIPAQYISIRTVPIPTGEQFAIFPSNNMGMGDVRIAIDDPVGDPFANPARGALASELRLYALPTLYGEANDWVGGRSMPLAVTVPGRVLFGSAAFALQQLSDSRRTGWAPVGTDSDIRDNSSNNVYAFAALGLRLSGGRTAFGISAFRADLEAVDGVNMLYGNSFAIEQEGDVTELRFGALHDFGHDRRLDIVILRNRLDMTHTVYYADWVVLEADPSFWTPTTWNEVNHDRTVTWAAQLRYDQPLHETARLGFLLTGNTKAHPKIPNYSIVNIPRDPGNSAMFNMGVGVSNTSGPAIVAAEVIYEPGRSHTWAYGDPCTGICPLVLLAPVKTVDNQFRFNNWSLGLGARMENDKHGVQLGLRLREIRYSLEQKNFLANVQRNTRESWVEWMPGWGAVLKFADVDVRYTGRLTAKGWPDSTPDEFLRVTLDMAMAGGTDFVIGPTGPVWLPEYRVTTHRLTVSVPLGR
jgi:hypothetical protein